jgi:L-lactate dehydrogenase complex protein LldG
MKSEGSEGRAAILKSIREHLLASAVHDAVHSETLPPSEPMLHAGKREASQAVGDGSLAERFQASLEAVDGACVIVENENAVIESVKRIIASLTVAAPPKVALSDDPFVKCLAAELESAGAEISVTPDASSLFDFDLGLTAVQAAIAETGTLVLQSDRERNRLISLVPPVHVAIVEANQLYLTLGEALEKLRHDGDELSPAITFITGPSRTADIELTLAIGVHGPRKLFVIINAATE